MSNAAANSGAPLDWKFQQVFGDSTRIEDAPERECSFPFIEIKNNFSLLLLYNNDIIHSPSCPFSRTHKIADIISTVQFDPSGNYLAIGDRGGRVVILERTANKVSTPTYSVCVRACVCVFTSHEIHCREDDDTMTPLNLCFPLTRVCVHYCRRRQNTRS